MIPLIGDIKVVKEEGSEGRGYVCVCVCVCIYIVLSDSRCCTEETNTL